MHIIICPCKDHDTLYYVCVHTAVVFVNGKIKDKIINVKVF